MGWTGIELNMESIQEMKISVKASQETNWLIKPVTTKNRFSILNDEEKDEELTLKTVKPPPDYLPEKLSTRYIHIF